MKYDFDKVINRSNTNSLKYDFAAERGKPGDVLPLWVADMDFCAPDEVIAALKKKAEHGIFGYSEPKDDYFQTLCEWFACRHGWAADPKKFVVTCGVVFSICSLLKTVTEEGDAVLICQPVYYPFAESVLENGRKLVVSELKNNGGYYTVDFDDFERKIAENSVKAFILCNPHNPVGRVWTREELLTMGEICLRHGVFVISDEIHEDFVYGGKKHTVFPAVKEAFAQNCAVCTAPTKTFNLAGLHIANTYIENDEVRKKFVSVLNAQGFSQPNIMGLVACKAAYRFGTEWLDQLIPYLEANAAFTEKFLAEHLPEIGFRKPEGTYLVWLDCRKLGMSDSGLKALMLGEAKLWLDDGYIFGAGGSGFERINIACPRKTLEAALERLKHAIISRHR